MELLQALEQNGLVDGLDAAEKQRLSDLGDTLTFRGGETIIPETNRSRDLYLIAKGSATIRMTLPFENRKSEVLDRLHEGELIGEIAFIDGSPRSASVVAETDCSLYHFPYETTHDFLEANPRVGYALVGGIAKILAAKIRQTSLAWRNLMMW